MTRPAYDHALLTRRRRVPAPRAAAHAQVRASIRRRLIHALQNHDELTMGMRTSRRARGRDVSIPRQADDGQASCATPSAPRCTRALIGDERALQPQVRRRRREPRRRRSSRRRSASGPPRPDRRRRWSEIKRAAPAARLLQRLSAGRVRAVGLGSGRRAHAAGESVQRAARRRRHALDQPRRLRPDRLESRGHASRPRVYRAPWRSTARCRSSCRIPTPSPRSWRAC